MSDFIKRASDGLQNVVAGLATWRDKHFHSSYATTQGLAQDQRLLDTMYRDSWLAKKVVNSVAEDMVREWFKVSVKDEDDFDFIQIEKRWKLRGLVEEAIRWSRLYGGAGIVIGTKGSELSQPLEQIVQDDLLFLRVVDKFRLVPGTLIDEDISSENFDLPLTYLMQPTNIEIHWTRVLRFEGQSLPKQAWLENQRWGDSELQHIFESIKSYDSIKASIVSMFYEANVDVLKVNQLTEMLATKGGEEMVIKRFQTAALMKSFNRVFLIDSDEEYEKKSNNFTNLAEVWSRFVSDVAGAAEIPITRLFGETPGGIAATGKGELVNYYDMISNKQQTDLLDKVEKLVRYLILNENGNEVEFEIEFNPLWQVPESESATVRKTRADMDKIYYDMGVVTPVEIARELLNEKLYSAMTEESIKMLEELENEIPDEPDPLINMQQVPGQTAPGQVLPNAGENLMENEE
jgi:uncharacterized protein